MAGLRLGLAALFVGCELPCPEPRLELTVTRNSLILAALCLAVFAAQAQSGPKSTPEERQQWAVTLHKFEADPLDTHVQAEAAHAANRLKDVDDVTIAPCGMFAELPTKWDKSWGVVVYLLAMSAYQVESGKSDTPGENLYALRSVLKTYASAVAKDPKLKDKKLDQLSSMEAAGKLQDLLPKDSCAK